MGVFAGPEITESGLVLSLDAANNKSILSAVEVLVVAGGGGGGGEQETPAGGGGGAGGLIYSSSHSITPGSAITATVGGGGAGGIGRAVGSNGGNSVFGALTAIGGGGGGFYSGLPSSGGSGGGAGWRAVVTSGGIGTAGQGFAGGSVYEVGNLQGAAGGGGAGGVGGDSIVRNGGAGGVGLQFTISGTPTYYAGGGGGGGGYGDATPGTGAIGGSNVGGSGGNASAGGTVGSPGVTNSGSGGGGAGADDAPGYIQKSGGAGGSGIVIVRYPGSQRATGGTVTSVGGHTIHTFTTSGTFTFTPNFGDMSGNGNTGELENGVGYNSANRGSLTFDGSNQIVRKSSATINFSGGTMEVWVYFNNFNGAQGPFSMSTNPTYINFYMPTSRLMRWEVIGHAGSAYGTISSTYVIEPSTWYHFVGTFGEGNTTKLYINGVLNNSQSNYTNVPTNFTSAIILGEYAGYLNGRISNAKIYNRALTAAEVSQNFNALRGRFGADDPGNGQGYSIAQSASSTNGVYTSTSSTNYISSWYLSAGGNGTPLNYTCSGSGANFAYHTGHNGNSSQWPMYHAIQVSANTYGQVINRINWYKHSNACGNVDIWGTTRVITSGNYTDTNLYTYLGRVNMGGYGSASECNVSSGTFNSSSYGYNWILLQVQDISGVLSYPSVGTLGGWAMYGMQLVKQ